MNLSDMLKRTSQKYPSNIAITSEERSITYIALEEESSNAAKTLKSFGIDRGDRVVLLAENSIGWVAAYFGIIKIGAIAVPLDAKYKQLELESIFLDCRPKCIITLESHYKPVIEAAKVLVENPVLLKLGGGDCTKLEAFGEFSKPLLENVLYAPVTDDDIAHISYTSGPVLKNPLGVMIAHGKLVEGLAISKDNLKQTEKDIAVLVALPMHHMVGLVVVMLTAFYCGSSVIMLSGLSVEALLKTIKDKSTTIFVAVPFVHALLLKEASGKSLDFDFSKLKVAGSIGAPLTQELAESFNNKFGKRLMDFYGLTESTVQVTSQEICGSTLGSVGKALGGWEIKVVNKDGEALSQGQEGKVMAKGPIMKGIYGKAEETARLIKNGWLDTGDLGYLDGEGNLFLTGNVRKMLINKGQNIYFSDIEEVLKTNEKVAEAAVVGIPDPDGMRGEVVAIAVKPKNGTSLKVSEIKKYCIDRLAVYKTPKEILITEDLPLKENSVIDYEALKKMFT